jgi:hypothetical protein
VAGCISGAQGDGGAGALGGMSDASAFDANRRPAEGALWTDAGARWIQQAAAQGRRDGRLGQVAVIFNAAELEVLVAGLRGTEASRVVCAFPQHSKASKLSFFLSIFHSEIA